MDSFDIGQSCSCLFPIPTSRFRCPCISGTLSRKASSPSGSTELSSQFHMKMRNISTFLERFFPPNNQPLDIFDFDLCNTFPSPHILLKDTI